DYFDETYELVKKYTEERLLLLKIQSAKKTAKLTSKVIFIFIAAILLFFVVMFLGLMLSYYFAEKLNSNFYGFSIVAGLYFTLLLLFIILYKAYFSGRIMDMVTGIFFENDPNDDDDDDEED
ncbi:MAG: phage holin family protein, partial [Bacteroidia bacterium]|nr:phage holin family protein [Bacteroidia bacterium]